jgi:short-subunit dehydrogenase
MSRFRDKIIFITGASSGIGAELARQFIKEEGKVFLFARRAERLQQLSEELDPSGKKVAWIAGDVTKKEDLNKAVEKTIAHFGKLDIAIANAGFGVAGNVSDLSLEDFERQFSINVYGVLNTIYAVEEPLRQSKGQLVLIGSVAGFIPLPGNSAYTMSKFSVRALSGALQHEWKKWGVAVTHLAPGFVDSDIRRTDNKGNLKPEHTDPIPSWLRVTTAQAVGEMLTAIYKRKKQKVITGHGKVFVMVNQYFPRLIPWLVGLSGIRSRPEPK